jgi:hypothetical protein
MRKHGHVAPIVYFFTITEVVRKSRYLASAAVAKCKIGRETEHERNRLDWSGLQVDRQFDGTETNQLGLPAHVGRLTRIHR